MALSGVSSYSTVITARLHSAMKDEMSPFGTCSLSYSQCVFSDRLHISYPSLIMWMCTVPICLYLCELSLLSGWYVVVHMLNVSGGTCRRPGFSSVLSSPRPGAAEWGHLAQKTPFLRGKWSVHNLDQ